MKAHHVTRVVVCRMVRPCIALTLLFTASLQATIQNGGVMKHTAGSSKQAPTPRNSGVLVVPPITEDILRGNSVDIPILVSPFSDSLRVKVLSPPKHGRLESIENRPGAVAVFRYAHDRESKDPEDDFTILIADRFSEYGTKQTAHIQISNPQPVIKVIPEGLLDFGKIPIGEASTNELTISNPFGAPFRDSLKVSPPWRIEGDPVINLPEGASTTIRLIFEPKIDGGQSVQMTPETPQENFPEVFLRGEGVAPFELMSASRVELTKEAPDSTCQLSNATTHSLEISLTGLPEGVESPCLLAIPAHSTGKIPLSAAHLPMPPDLYVKQTLSLTSGSYRKQVELIVKGPNAPPTMELLNARDGHGARLGIPLVLEGVVRNSSQEERSLDVVLGEFGKAVSLAKNSFTLPAHGATNFQFHWSPVQIGHRSLSIELREHGVVLDRKPWPVEVKAELVPVPSPVTPNVDKSKDRPTGYRKISASGSVIDLRPDVKEGLLLNQLSLTWRYSSSEKTGFLIQQLNQNNSFIDHLINFIDHLVNRTSPGGETQPQWKTLKKVTIVSTGINSWSVRLPFRLPGHYTFKVIPGDELLERDVQDIGDNYEKVGFQQTILPFGYLVFFWPAIRDILIVICLLLVVRELRRRI